MNNQFETLSQATNHLNKLGYNLNFKLGDNAIECQELDKSFQPESFIVDEFHRFEGNTDPGDMSIVYALTTKDGDRGMLIEAYGGTDNPQNDSLIRRLKIKDN